MCETDHHETSILVMKLRRHGVGNDGRSAPHTATTTTDHETAMLQHDEPSPAPTYIRRHCRLPMGWADRSIGVVDADVMMHRQKIVFNCAWPPHLYGLSSPEPSLDFHLRPKVPIAETLTSVGSEAS